MLTVAPYLRTRRPSPTTVEYTVSTSPPLTLPLRLLILFTHLIRLSLGLSILLLLYSKYLTLPFATPHPPYPIAPFLFSNDYIYFTLSQLLSTRPGLGISYIAHHTPLLILVVLSALTLTLLLLRRHTTESLLVLRGLGIQTSTSSLTYLSTATTRFIPMEKMQDVFVNEAFRGFEVRYLLVVVVEGEGGLEVVFPRLLPGREVVEVVWRGVRGCLGEGAGASGAGGGGGGGGKE